MLAASGGLVRADSQRILRIPAKFNTQMHPSGVRRIQSLRAFRRPHLDDWMLGCFEDWREDWEDWKYQEDGWIERIARIGTRGGWEGLVGWGEIDGHQGESRKIGENR